MLFAALALLLQDPDAAHAESLLRARQLPQALATAERLVARRPHDPQAHLVLGRVHFARPVVGRYAALEHFRAAAALAPEDPEPLYRQAEVGFYLGGDDGDALAREVLLQLFVLLPDYRDAWALFQRLFQNDDIWRGAEGALARHGDDPVALERRAELLLCLGEPRRADSLLALVLARRGPSVPVYLLRARAGFEAGRDSAGYVWYDSALAHAARDSAETLWGTTWMIASRRDAIRYAATRPEARAAFFTTFWGPRDPNLVTRENERIAEHFRRLAEARRQFRLLHPQSLYHHSARFRALAGSGARDLLQGDVFFARCDTTAVPGGLKVKCRPGYAVRPADSAAAEHRMGPGPPEAAADGGETPSARAGLDARGLVWVRHGPPEVRRFRTFDPLRPIEIEHVSPHDLEGWAYYTPEGALSIAFARGTAGLYGGQLGGDYIVLPATARQARNAERLLETERTSVAAPIAVRAWRAAFRSAAPGRTDVYHRANPDPAAVALWRADGAEAARAAGAGVLALVVTPGRYRVGLDADSGGRLGRLRREITVPAFPPDELRLSSLVLARLDTLPDRETALRAMPVSLTYAGDAPLAAYAEIYGLAADSLSVARYEARYTFERVRGGAPIGFAFVREAPAGPVLRERLIVEPGRVPPGRYRVTLSVTDLRRNVKSEPVALEITIR